MLIFAVFVLATVLIIKIIAKYSCLYNGPECLIGKVAVITGGNKGIGLEVSKYLASRGCKVIIGCRSKGETERNLIELTNNKNIEVKHLDLQSYESVRSFCKDIHKSEDKIDILINNAGIGVSGTLSPDGLHPVMQTNVFSPFLLTHLLSDLLKKSGDGRIVFTSSIVAFKADLTLENLNPPPDSGESMNKYFTIYGNSKLAEIIISNKLAEKLSKYDVKSNAIHPGFIDSGIWESLEFKKSLTPLEIALKWFFYISIFLYSRTSQEGAQGIVELAISKNRKDTTGQFFWGVGMANIYPSPTCLKNKSFCDAVWKKIESLTNLKPEEMLE